MNGKYNDLTNRGMMVKDPSFVIEMDDRLYGFFRLNDMFDGIPWRLRVTLSDIDDFQEDPPDKKITLWAETRDGPINKYVFTLEDLYDQPVALDEHKVDTDVEAP